MNGKTTVLTLKVNDLELHWDEEQWRVEKPCEKCQKKTRGRHWTGGGLKKPAHVACAIDLFMKRALSIYRQA
jgi:hypothetical protein